MATIDEIKKNRLKKLKKIENFGWSAYPDYDGEKRSFLVSQVLLDFSKLSKSKKEIVLTGRIMRIREHGSLLFGDIKDGSGRIQFMIKKNELGEKGFNFFLENFDIGDFVELKGFLTKTKKGEKTLETRDYKILAKSLLPLPEKWHGLKDVEERFRKRYLDLLFNDDIKEKFILRSKIVKEIKNFLEKNDFIETETPILQPLYGGAKAKPFKTYLNAFDMEMYLRISPELYLKRLLIGGFEKVYEIGRCFRNEGVDRSHNPEFTMLEFYWAYTDYKRLMRFTEEMFKEVLKKIFGTLKIRYENKEIDFKAPWPRIEFNVLIKKYTKIDLDEINTEALRKKAKELLGFDVKGDKPEIADEIYKKYCRPKIWNPVFVIHHPVGFQPLAKALNKNPKKLANFQLIVAGFEIVNAFSEQNNPLEQKRIFEEQERIKKEGFEEAQPMDKDFIEALEYGMPPAAGFGMGIDRLAALLTNSHALREIILFPTMKKKK